MTAGAGAHTPIPVTLINGFLGSGKTTLILNLVSQLRSRNPSYRIALLKNELGDLAVDSQLATSNAISGVKELLNGCICCYTVGGIAPALEEMRNSIEADRIIVETSGGGHPATLAIEINNVAKKTGLYSLDGVISVIDVENWEGYQDTSYSARKQAEFTDVIVFNKWETAGEDRYDTCLDHLGDMNVDVPRVKSDRGWVSVDLIFGTDGTLGRLLQSDQIDQINGAKSNGHHSHDHGGNGHQHKHDSDVEVLSIELKGEGSSKVSWEKLEKLLTSAPKDDVYRIKAVLTLSSRPRNSDAALPPPAEVPGDRYILNWAFTRWTFTPLAETESEHASSSGVILRMSIMTERQKSKKWKRKIEEGGLIELDGDEPGELSVERIV